MDTYDLVVSHLQHEYDILNLVYPSIENIFLSKTVLRGFELILDLWVNFVKSNLIEVNLDYAFMNLVEDFL